MKNRIRSLQAIGYLAASLLLAAYSGSSPPPSAPSPTLSYGVKQLHFAWSAVAGATHYRLREDPDGPGPAPYTPVGGNITATRVNHTIFLPKRLNATYIVSACNAGGCTDSAPLAVSATLVEAVGYVKASNTEGGDLFGWALALSADGNTLAVGAPQEASAATGIGGNQNDNSATAAGAVYLY